MKSYGVILAGLAVFTVANSSNADIISDLASATIIEEFLFDDPAGTSYDAAANNINAGLLLSSDSDLAGVVTNGAGALDANTKNNTSFGSTLVDSASDSSTGRYLGVMELTWDFRSVLDPAENEEIRLSIINSGTSSVTAEFEIQREDDDTLTIFGNAIGTGSVDIAPVLLNGGSLTQSTKFIAVIDADLTADTMALHFSADGGTTFTSLTGGVLDSARGFDKMRIILNNDLVDDNILVDRAYIATVIPEPASIGLLGIALSGLSLSRRRR